MFTASLTPGCNELALKEPCSYTWHLHRVQASINRHAAACLSMMPLWDKSRQLPTWCAALPSLASNAGNRQHDKLRPSLYPHAHGPRRNEWTPQVLALPTFFMLAQWHAAATVRKLVYRMQQANAGSATALAPASWKATTILQCQIHPDTGVLCATHCQLALP